MSGVLGEVFAVVRSDEEWRRAIRDRADALGYTRRSISLAAGLTESHAERILTPVPMKRMGEMSRYALTGAVELEVVLRIAKRQNSKTAERRMKTSSQGVRLGRILSLRFLRRIAKKGGKARWPKDPKKRSAFARKLALVQVGKMTPKELSARARRMSNIRWADVKAAAAEQPKAAIREGRVARAPGTSAAAAPPSGSRPDRPMRTGATSAGSRPAPAPQRKASDRAGAKPR